MEPRDLDVIVVGGAAWVAAAIDASGGGADRFLAKRRRLGGSTGL